jgi:hypothetical protein
MSTVLSLPPIAILAESAADLAEQAADASHARAINKAAYYLHTGLDIVPTAHGFLIPSGSRTGVVHRISNVGGCDCEAAAKGNVCWHSAAISILEEAQKYTRPTMPALPMGDKLTRARKALAEINELF